ncbi:unnamed protein product, partial [Bubo scandiacus]
CWQTTCKFFLLLVLQLGKQSHSAAWKTISVIFTSDRFVDCKIKGGFGIRDPDLSSSSAEAVNPGWFPGVPAFGICGQTGHQCLAVNLHLDCK